MALGGWNNNIMIKGLKCNNCGCEFKWIEATERKMQGIQSVCKCPECNQLITSEITTANFIAAISFAIIFFSVAFWSILYSTSQNTIIIGAIGFVLSFFIPRLFFQSGYLQMVKVKQ